MTFPRAEILSIGTEMTQGPRPDTNSVWLRGRLSRLNLCIMRVTSVSDDRQDLVEALSEGIHRAGLLLTTGGLGPTEDDRTVDALAAATGRPLHVVDEVLAGLEEKARRKGQRLRASAARMARMPSGFRALENGLGSAPGLLLETEELAVAALPGVPAEMRWIYDEVLHGALEKRFGPARNLRRVIRIGGLSESSVEARVAPLCGAAGLAWTVLALPGMIELHVSGKAAELSELAARLDEDLGPDIISVDGRSLASVILDRLKTRQETLAIAESCTGGGAAALVTAEPGASQAFKRGYVVYNEASKKELLDVPSGLLRTHGAVSGEVARAMVEGLVRRSGCAGPAGGIATTPVGTVWCAAGGTDSVHCRRWILRGDRAQIRDAAACHGLDLLRRTLISRGVS
ncbi:MAG: nicotinamide-nucleotide amidohydrolase family protein [Acidobacteriota bacterium]